MAIDNYIELQNEMIRSLIFQPKLIQVVPQIIDEDDFSIDINKKVFKALLDMEEVDEINQIALENKVYERDYTTLTRENVETFFHNLFPVSPPIELAKKLRRFSKKEKASFEYKKAIEFLENKNGVALEDIGLLMENLEKIRDDLTPKTNKTFKEQLEDFLARGNNTEEEIGVPSFYPSLDKFTGGWQKGDLITVAARTSIGKSVFATNCAVSAGLAKKKVLFFSLEMNYNELISRLVSCLGFIKLNKLYPKMLIKEGDEDYNKFLETIETIKKMNLVIDDSADIGIDYIKSKIKEVHKEESPVDLIIIDYIQLLSLRNKGRSRQEEVAEISRSLKVLAASLKIPIMVVAQLNREGKEDDDRIPSKADIRESGAIANDSNVIIIIHRKYRDKSDDPKGLIILDKNRNGVADKRISVRCLLDRAMFQDIDNEENQQNYQDNSQEDIEEEIDFNDFLDDF